MSCPACHVPEQSAEARFCDLPGCPINPQTRAEPRHGSPASVPFPSRAGGRFNPLHHDFAYGADPGHCAPGKTEEISAAVHQ